MRSSKFIDLYAILEVQRNCNDEQIKVAYKRLALARHPDKNLDDPNATAHFQVVSNFYCLTSAVLIDVPSLSMLSKSSPTNPKEPLITLNGIVKMRNGPLPHRKILSQNSPLSSNKRPKNNHSNPARLSLPRPTIPPVHASRVVVPGPTTLITITITTTTNHPRHGPHTPLHLPPTIRTTIAPRSTHFGLARHDFETVKNTSGGVIGASGNGYYATRVATGYS